MLFLSILIIPCFAQFDFDDGFGPPMGPDFGGPPPFGPPPFRPFGRFGHHRPPWARGPRPFGPPFPPPPFFRRRRPFGPPPFDDPPPPPFLPPQEFQPSPPAPPPQRAPPPVQKADVYGPNIRALINDVNRLNTAFRGQSYETVAEALRQFYTRKSGVQFDPPRAVVSSAPLHNEIRANHLIAGGMFESDMILTMSQLNSIMNNRHRRKAIADMSKRWTTRVSYKFLDTDGSWQSVIRSALNLYETHTCLRFQENGGGDVIVFNKGQGCYSSVGRQGGQQEVSLGDGCQTIGIAAHEIAHALGLWHEQSRPDRDSFIRVNYGSIIRGYEASFEKRSTADANNMGIPYDYGSVMHYSSNSFSKNFGDDTITPHQTQFKQTIGNRVEPAFLDYKALNTLYCSSNCRELPCKNGGYTNPNTCTSCVCPTGIGGTYCERLKESTCGGEVTATSQWQTLAYSGSGTCYWRIASPNNGRIRFQISNVHYACAMSCEEFVEIKYGNSMVQTGARMCCSATITSGVSEAKYITVISRATQSSQFSIQYMNEGGVAPSAPAQRSPVVSSPSSMGQWSGWSGCSEKCGACGTRTRSRRCRGRCSGPTTERQTCNLQACSRGTTLGGSRRGRRSTLQEFLTSVRSKRNTQFWCCERYLARGSVCVPV